MNPAPSNPAPSKVNQAFEDVWMIVLMIL